MSKNLFYNDTLLILIEGYVEFSIACIFASMVTDDSKDNNIVVNILGFIYKSVTLCVFPIFLLWFSFLDIRKIRKPEFRKKYSPIIHDVKLKNKLESIFFVIFISRRLIFIKLISLETTVYQILTMNFVNLAMLIY